MMASRRRISFRAKGKTVTFYVRPKLIRRKRREKKSWWEF